MILSEEFGDIVIFPKKRDKDIVILTKNASNFHSQSVKKQCIFNIYVSSVSTSKQTDIDRQPTTLGRLCGLRLVLYTFFFIGNTTFLLTFAAI